MKDRSTDFDVIVAGSGPAGTGAALAAGEGCTPRALPYQKVQEKLRLMGVTL